jgi:anti-anti-sigma regulatory factor
MARIRSMSSPSATVVTVAGRLGAGDMRRLEHACAPALTRRAPNLTVDIRHVTELDAAAGVLLLRFAARGARIRTAA